MAHFSIEFIHAASSYDARFEKTLTFEGSPSLDYFNYLTILYSYLTILVTCYSFMIRFNSGVRFFKEKRRFELMRHIRIFDVIFELYSVILRRRRRFEKTSHLKAENIPLHIGRFV